MTWYEWVWAITATLALLAVVVAGILVIIYEFKVKFDKDENIRELESECRAKDAGIKRLNKQIDELRGQLMEERKGHNNYGRIIP